MVKKVLITGLFIGGGLFFIRKILPKLNSKEYEADTKDYEVKRFISNRTGGGTGYSEQNVRNPLPFSVLTKAGEGNDRSWDFNPYSDRKQGDFIKGVNNIVL